MRGAHALLIRRAGSVACSEIVHGGAVVDRVAPPPPASKVVLLKIPSKKAVCPRRHTSPGWSPAASHKRSGPSPLCLKSIVAPAVTSLIFPPARACPSWRPRRQSPRQLQRALEEDP